MPSPQHFLLSFPHMCSQRLFLQAALSLTNCYHGAFVISGSGSLWAAACVAHYFCQSICSINMKFKSDDICDGFETVFAVLLDKLQLGLAKVWKVTAGTAICFAYQLLPAVLLATFLSLLYWRGRYSLSEFYSVFFHLNAANLIREWVKWELWYLIRPVKLILIHKGNAIVLCSDGCI